LLGYCLLRSMLELLHNYVGHRYWKWVFYSGPLCGMVQSFFHVFILDFSGLSTLLQGKTCRTGDHAGTMLGNLHPVLQAITHPPRACSLSSHLPTHATELGFEASILSSDAMPLTRIRVRFEQCVAFAGLYEWRQRLAASRASCCSWPWKLA
jgi:hypothetical protein